VPRLESPTVVLYREKVPVVVYRPTVVRVVKGPDVGASSSLTHKRASVGSSPKCDLVLTDEHVSRHHLEFRVADHGYIALDMGSTNGTYYGGARIHKALLASGAEVRLGKTTLRLESSDEVHERVEERDSFGELIGRSPVMRKLYGILATVASTDATVLLEGETGTGKEIAAQAIHTNSPRAKSSLVVVDCGSLPAELIESEIFGHERGAFTGAIGERAGAFERARGGTVFLDEVAELPLELQTRLLRAIDRREVKRVGGSMYRKVDVRVIAATNLNLKAEVAAKRFREDLFYRLAVIPVHMPPLRKRAGDVTLLARHFLWEAGCPEPEAILDESMVALLESRRWGGNVRELRNAIERAALRHAGIPIADEDTHAVTHAPTEAPSPASNTEPNGDGLKVALSTTFLEQPYKQAKEQLLCRFEGLYLARLMAMHGDNLSALAREAQVDRNIIRRLLREREQGEP